MPIYHLAVRAISRSAGRSAVAAAAYRAGVRLRCDRTGRVFDFSRRHGVVATQVIVPQSETTVDRQTLWDLAEAAEKRVNSTVAREIELALPCELDAPARKTLVLAFAADLVARYGIAVDVAVHEPNQKGDTRNHHAHILTSTRVLGPDGSFGRKVRQLDDRKTGPAEVVALRASWAAMCNAALTAAGVTDTVDHRSHRERGLPDEPGRKLGPAAVGLERRTGTVSRRRAEYDAERAANENTIPLERERSESVGPRDHGANRRQAHRAALNGLCVQFAAATAAAMAGRPHPLLNEVFAPSEAAPQRRQGTAVSSRRPFAGSPWSVPQVRPRGAIAPGIPASQVGKRKRQGYDEAAEAAAMYRRVDLELDAEHKAQMAEEQAETKRAAVSVGRGRPLNALEFRIAEVPALLSVVSRKRTGTVAIDPMRRQAADEGFDRPTSDRHDIGSAAEVAAVPAPGPTTDHGPELRDLAVMAAHELARRHKRSRARLCRLAELVGMDEAAFAARVGSREETVFDPALLAWEPAFAELWEAWMDEDRAKQRDRTDDRSPTAAPEAVPSAEPSRDAGPLPAALVPETGDAVAASPLRPYTRRDAVTDFAITVIGRGGWSPEVGDAVAGLLRTQRGWLWREAHRVCRARHGANRPQSLPVDVLGTIRRRSRAEAARHGQMGRTMDDIDRGRIGRGIV